LATSKLEDDTMSCQSAAVDTMVLFLACVVLKTSRHCHWLLQIFSQQARVSDVLDLTTRGAMIRKATTSNNPRWMGPIPRKADLARIACHSSLESVRDPLFMGSNREESGILFVPALATR